MKLDELVPGCEYLDELDQRLAIEQALAKVFIDGSNAVIEPITGIKRFLNMVQFIKRPNKTEYKSKEEWAKIILNKGLNSNLGTAIKNLELLLPTHLEEHGYYMGLTAYFTMRINEETNQPEYRLEYNPLKITIPGEYL